MDTRKAGLILLHYLSFPTNAKQLSFPRELLYVLSLHSPSDISIELETFLCGRLMMVVSNSLKVPKGYSYKLLCSQSPLCFLQPICLYEIKFYFHFPPKVYSIYQYFSLPNLAFFISLLDYILPNPCTHPTGIIFLPSTPPTLLANMLKHFTSSGRGCCSHARECCCSLLSFSLLFKQPFCYYY